MKINKYNNHKFYPILIAVNIHTKRLIEDYIKILGIEVITSNIWNYF